MTSRIGIFFIVASYLVIGAFGSAEIWRTFPIGNPKIDQLRDFYAQSLQSAFDGAQQTTTFNGARAIQGSKMMIMVPVTSSDEKRSCITELASHVVHYCRGYDRCKINVNGNCRLLQSPENFGENCLVSEYSAAMGSNAPSIFVNDVVTDHNLF